MDHSHHAHHPLPAVVVNNSAVFSTINTAAPMVTPMSVIGEHEHHDMGDMDMNHDMMEMNFHFGVTNTILFKQWKTDSVLTLVLSMVGIYLFAMAYEGLKYYRQYLHHRFTVKTHTFSSISLPNATNGNASLQDQAVGASMFSWQHGIQTGLHCIQFVMSYFLMLIFMTYNVWLCLAVAAGATAGYFVFGWRKTSVVDVTECCH